MIPASRRVVLYWVLLLLPTLTVGGGVLWLLGREQARINTESRAALEARREAVGARARLIAENVELLIGDVQSGLMATLREAPADRRVDTFLEDWRRSNPLVRGAFYDFADGRGVRAQGGLVAAWFPRMLARTKPWVKRVDAEVAQAERPVKQSVTTNSLRETFQQTANIKGGPAIAPERSGWAPLREDGALHLIGWREWSGGGVVGVEVELAQIAARLGELLPEGREPGEVYELRERGGAVYRPKDWSEKDRALAEGGPLVTAALSETVLPGWEVAGYLATAPDGMAGGVLFALSAVLAGTLVAAILAGGTLLLWQARRSEAEAAQKTSFVANVSHEFKTPLTTIRLYAELLEQGRVADAEKRAEYLRTIGRETKRLARLVNNVLDFSRLEQGRKRFACARVDLTAELSCLLDTHAPRVAEAGLELRRQLPQEALVVTTDRDALEQIVINLVDNACKYASGGGIVDVRLSTGKEEPGVCHVIRDKPLGAVVRVADRGPGVPAAQRERIFEKFHRVDDTLVAERTGAGLGLSIARQLARGLGGDLTCEEREGGGAVFVLTLPEVAPGGNVAPAKTLQT